MCALRLFISNTIRVATLVICLMNRSFELVERHDRRFSTLNTRHATRRGAARFARADKQSAKRWSLNWYLKICENCVRIQIDSLINQAIIVILIHNTRSFVRFAAHKLCRFFFFVLFFFLWIYGESQLGFAFHFSAVSFSSSIKTFYLCGFFLVD